MIPRAILGLLLMFSLGSIPAALLAASGGNWALFGLHGALALIFGASAVLYAMLVVGGQLSQEEESDGQ